MSDGLYESLAWLPQPPDDFRVRCRSARSAGSIDASTLRFLATHALDEQQARRLADVVETVDIRADGVSLEPFALGVIGNATLEPLVPVLVATGLRYGFRLRCIKGDYAQLMQEALDPASAINRAAPDAVLFAIDHRGLPLASELGGADGEAAVERAIDFVRRLRGGIAEYARCPSIVQTLARPPETLFGSLDRSVPGTMQANVEAFNRQLRDLAGGSRDLVLDVGGLAETVGLADWHAPVQWNVAKFPFNARFLPLYADHVCRTIAALRGKSRRCLVLDLDNTVWGGVIGDDGIDGIAIAEGDATGEAHRTVQRYALLLRSRGVVLAVSSKNDDGVAREPFRRHPEMLLREEHIAVFQANWSDKATNISAIAGSLALGIDSLVFLDDNPAERKLVRERLPSVAVPELPNDPALFARTLAAAGYFEAIAFSAEDGARAAFYQADARRVALQETGGDLDGYLASLEMTIVFRPFDALGRTRIAQLINKSNQFNLTTRRYDEYDVERFEADPATFTLAVRLLDAFGDNGMISVVIARPVGESTWAIDTWLMSCRVLGRKVEQMVLREIVAQARARGIAMLVGDFIPTARNDMVRAHYARLGFTLVEEAADGATRWELATDSDVPAAPMRVDRQFLEPSPV